MNVVIERHPGHGLELSVHRYRDEAAAPRTLTDRVLRGGLVPGLRAFLLRSWTERLITAVIIFSLM